MPDPPGAEDDHYHGDGFEERSILDDLLALYEDVKIYIEAELNFQKSRLKFTLKSLKLAAAFGGVALVCVFLALIGLTVGLIIALTPIITAWGATFLVVGGLLIIAYASVKKLIDKVKAVSRAFAKDDNSEVGNDV
nr:phage holin family protein [Altericroceibacterium endophyticum]